MMAHLPRLSRSFAAIGIAALVGVAAVGVQPALARQNDPAVRTAKELRAIGEIRAAAAAQAAGQANAAVPGELDGARAEEVRSELQRLLERYPPALGRIFKLDPTLMSDPKYLASYPDLVVFLQRHPEVPRYSSYFLSFIGDSDWQEPRDPDTQVRMRAMDMWHDVFGGAAILTGFLSALVALTWLVRYTIAHRRWIRATKLQADMQNRLLERFTASSELLAYVQSPAGQNILATMPPLGLDTATAPIAAPFSRILWSLQAGFVIVSAGVGLLIIRHYVVEEISEMMLVLGTLAVSLGIGFALASAASYMLSHRLGLFDATARRPRESNEG
jgi:hypothetical protein